VTLVFVPALLSLMMEFRGRLLAGLSPEAPVAPRPVEAASTRLPPVREEEPIVAR
jgi:hypothetical protein